MAAVLDVPRLAPGALALPDPALLPVSRLFDPLAPQTHTTTADLKLEPTNELGVALSMVPGQGSSSSSVEDVDGQVVLAVEPGSTAEVRGLRVLAGSRTGPACVVGQATPECRSAREDTSGEKVAVRESCDRWQGRSVQDRKLRRQQDGHPTGGLACCVGCRGPHWR